MNTIKIDKNFNAVGKQTAPTFTPTIKSTSVPKKIVISNNFRSLKSTTRQK